MVTLGDEGPLVVACFEPESPRLPRRPVPVLASCLVVTLVQRAVEARRAPDRDGNRVGDGDPVRGHFVSLYNSAGAAYHTPSSSEASNVALELGRLKTAEALIVDG